MTGPEQDRAQHEPQLRFFIDATNRSDLGYVLQSIVDPPSYFGPRQTHWIYPLFVRHAGTVHYVLVVYIVHFTAWRKCGFGAPSNVV